MSRAETETVNQDGSHPPRIISLPADGAIRLSMSASHETEATAKVDSLRKFGSRVRELREARGLRQSDLAERAGIDRVSVVRIEQGLRDVGVSRVVALAAALQVRPQDLFD